MPFKVFVLDVNLHGWSGGGGSHGATRRIRLCHTSFTAGGTAGGLDGARDSIKTNYHSVKESRLNEASRWIPESLGRGRLREGKTLSSCYTADTVRNQSRSLISEVSLRTNAADTLLSLLLQLRGSKLTLPDPFLGLFSYFKLAPSFRFRPPFTAAHPTPPAFVFSF